VLITLNNRHGALAGSCSFHVPQRAMLLYSLIFSGKVIEVGVNWKLTLKDS
jgi:hypothetical protein